jgi:hypothetical protein
MASKKFKGCPCAYCAVGSSTTIDHVFARGFFPLDQRADLPQAPACDACNRSKSEIEHYLTAVLPFGGRQPGSVGYLEKAVPPKLAKNAKLHRLLNAGQGRAFTVQPTGLVVPATVLPLDGVLLERYFGYVVKGLLWHHWQEVLAVDAFVDVLSLTARGEKMFAPFISMRTDRRVDCVVGNGIFSYAGLQGIDNRQVSVWSFTAFGGLKVSDGTNDECSRWGVLTGPAKVKANAERAGRALRLIELVSA